MLCESCFWCCTFYGNLKKTITQTYPYCWQDRLKLIPVLLNEIHYSFDYRLKNKELSHLERNRIVISMGQGVVLVI